jgi:hypothetical protein
MAECAGLVAHGRPATVAIHDYRNMDGDFLTQGKKRIFQLFNGIRHNRKIYTNGTVIASSIRL